MSKLQESGLPGSQLNAPRQQQIKTATVVKLVADELLSCFEIRRTVLLQGNSHRQADNKGCKHVYVCNFFYFPRHSLGISRIRTLQLLLNWENKLFFTFKCAQNELNKHFLPVIWSFLFLTQTVAQSTAWEWKPATSGDNHFCTSSAAAPQALSPYADSAPAVRMSAGNTGSLFLSVWVSVFQWKKVFTHWRSLLSLPNRQYYHHQQPTLKSSPGVTFCSL